MGQRCALCVAWVRARVSSHGATAPDELRVRAVEWHREGRLEAAAAGYRELLGLVPDDATALHMLGVLALGRGDWDAAERWLAQVTARHPGLAAAHVDLGAARAAQARHAEAIEDFGRALLHEPQSVAALVRRALAFSALGRVDAAAADARAALGIDPQCLPAHRALVEALAQAGSTEQAWLACRQGLACAPDDALLLARGSQLLLALERPADALDATERLLANHDADAAAHANQGVALLRLGRPAQALDGFRRASALDPALAEPHLNAAAALAALGRPADALEECDAALAIEPGLAVGHRNRGVLLFDLARPEQALASYERALVLAPDYVEAHVDRGTALRSLGRVEEACGALEAALRLQPGHAQARFNLADCLLHLGRYAQGWPLYEARRELPSAIVRTDLAGPRWSGEEEVRGRTIFVWWEQAIGDTLQFIRYATLLEQRGARVVVSLPRSLHALIGESMPGLTLLGETQAPARYDYHVPLMSLPGAFRTDAASIPAAVPYLRAQPARISAWRERLGSHGIKVGVSWQGAVRATGHGRAFALAELAPLAAVPGARLISLQKNAGVEQLATLPAGMVVEVPGESIDAGVAALLDTAAIIECLDLVVSCDTAIAHLAGALGKPTWIALKHVPDWRWNLSGPTTPWYPTARLFRQRQRWHWGPVFEEMAATLRERRT